MADPIGTYQERSALYYPYIHIRSENWLKSTLLAFQRVDRIVPYPNTLRDEEIIEPYTRLRGADGKPLLDQAEFQTERVAAAQKVLFQRLMEKEGELVKRYAEVEVAKVAQSTSKEMMRFRSIAARSWIVTIASGSFKKNWPGIQEGGRGAGRVRLAHGASEPRFGNHVRPGAGGRQTRWFDRDTVTANTMTRSSAIRRSRFSPNCSMCHFPLTNNKTMR